MRRKKNGNTTGIAFYSLFTENIEVSGVILKNKKIPKTNARGSKKTNQF
jgi:hypothetical protein